MRRILVLHLAGIVGLVSGCDRIQTPTVERPSDVQESSQAAAIAVREQRYEDEWEAMGVKFRVVLYAGDAKSAAISFDEARSIVAEINQALSDYLADSEVNRLCRSAPHEEDQPISTLLADVLRLANEASDLTDGAFDATSGSITHLWRAAIKRHRLPAPEKIEQARLLAGHEHMTLADSAVRIDCEGFQLDFGGIAKGYAADQVLGRLRELGIHRALVDASGDVTVYGTPPDREAWSVAIAGDAPDQTMALNLFSGSVATSGDRFQFLEVDDIRYSHIIDPRTGQSVTHTSMATVISPYGWLSDAFASACCVLQPDEALALVNQTPDVECRIIHREWNRETGEPLLSVYESPGFKRFLSVQE